MSTINGSKVNIKNGDNIKKETRCKPSEFLKYATLKRQDMIHRTCCYSRQVQSIWLLCGFLCGFKNDSLLIFFSEFGCQLNPLNGRSNMFIVFGET